MNPAQQQLSVGSTRATRNQDYIGLFPTAVFPSGEFDILERGDHLLIIKSYEYKQKIKPAQRRIYNLFRRHSRVLDGPGSITTICVWGLGPTPRELVVFDDEGEHPVIITDRDGFREWLAIWWRDHKGYR